MKNNNMIDHITNYLQSYDDSEQLGQAPNYGHTVKKKLKILI